MFSINKYCRPALSKETLSFTKGLRAVEFTPGQKHNLQKGPQKK